MEFSLKYRGSLPAASAGNSRVAEKQAIREFLRPQLANLWARDPRLAPIDLSALQAATFEHGHYDVPRPLQGASAFFFYHKVRGVRFVPLVNYVREAYCAVSIRLYRRDAPGQIIVADGDLDNRLKTLFDALRMPHSPSELPATVTPTGNQPFFCVLDDDALITKLSIETHRLLTDPAPGEDPGSVEMDIHVEVKAVTPMMGNIDWLF